MLAGYLLDASRNRHDLELVASAMGVSGGPPRAAWLGTGRTSRAPGEIGPEVAAERLGAEAAAVLAVAAAQRSALREAGLDQLYVELELPLSRVLARIEAHGIRIDSLELGRLGEELDRDIAALEAEIHRLAGTTFNIGSPKQLGEVLFGKLGLPVVRRTKTGPSTDADVLEELAALHEVPAKIVEYRGLTKLKSTYIEALPALVHPRTGRLHTTFNQAVAATGRLSSSEPNLQNIPIRTEVGRRIRQAFIADPGYRIVSADYSQIELRILAHFSEDPGLPGGLPQRGRHPPADGRRGLQRPARVGLGRAAAGRQGHQLRAGVRPVRVRAGPDPSHPTGHRQGLHRQLLRALRGGARLHGALHRRGPGDRGGDHPAGPPPAHPAR